MSKKKIILDYYVRELLNNTMTIEDIPPKYRDTIEHIMQENAPLNFA